MITKSDQPQSADVETSSRFSPRSYGRSQSFVGSKHPKNALQVRENAGPEEVPDFVEPLKEFVVGKRWGGCSRRELAHKCEETN